MSQFNAALVIFGATILLLGLSAGLIKERLHLSQPIIAMVVGVLIGPLGFDVLGVMHWDNQGYILEQAARITVAISVMGIALRLPRNYFHNRWRPLLVILVPGMLIMWLVSGFLIYGILGLSFWVAMLAGAIVTPTDPVLAGGIITGRTAEKHIPARVRNFMSAEAGSNDGLAYLLVLLPILLIQKAPSDALWEWTYRVIGWEVIIGVMLGVAIGLTAGSVQLWAHWQEYTGEVSLITITVALSLVTLGAVKLIHSDGILAVFAAGLAFNYLVNGRQQAREERVQEAFNRFLTIPSLVLFGMVLPWDEWMELGWPVVLVVVAILALRRLPMMLLLHRQLVPIRKRQDALFVGWFGPIGVAAIFYAMLSLKKIGDGQIWIVASAVVAASILAHGITATPLTYRYSRSQP
jgi:NhaP-type Na+/H+ or K+/H+ antiporter